MTEPEPISNHSSPVRVQPHGTVADKDSLQFDRSVLGEDLVGKERNVHTTVRLSGDPELVGLEFGEPLVEKLESFECILGGSGIVVDVIFVIVD